MSSQTKRERLIEAASALIHEQGFGRTTLADIARPSDVPLGNVHYLSQDRGGYRCCSGRGPDSGTTDPVRRLDERPSAAAGLNLVTSLRGTILVANALRDPGVVSRNGLRTWLERL